MLPGVTGFVEDHEQRPRTVGDEARQSALITLEPSLELTGSHPRSTDIRRL